MQLHFYKLKPFYNNFLNKFECINVF